MNSRSRFRKARVTKRYEALAPYRSQYEKNIANLLSENNIEFQYEPKKIDYIYPTKRGKCQTCGGSDVGRIATYTPDFWFPKHGVWVEAKGKWDSAGRTKTLAVLDSDNELNRDNFRMLFMYNNWVTSKHKEKYTDWCAKHKIICAVGLDVPEEWLQ